MMNEDDRFRPMGDRQKNQSSSDFSDRLRSQKSKFGMSRFAKSARYEPIVVARDPSIMSVDTTPPTRQQNIRKTLLAWWPEMCWCFLSIGCLIAIIVTLKSVDRKPQPRLAPDIPISAVIAFLATFCRMALTIPVAEGVSQLKWNWFAEGKARSLGNMEIFDLAGRGPWGSIKLLWVSRGRYLEVLVFFVIITGFLTSSITQAALTTTRLPNDFKLGKATVQSSGQFLGLYWELENFQMAAQYGYSTPPSQQIPPIDATCGSGYCDFPTFQTLGVCVALKNVTDQLNATESPPSSYLYNVTLPNGAELKYLNKQVDLGIVSGNGTTASKLLKSLAFKDQPKLMASRFLDMFIIWRITDPNEYEKRPGKPVRVQKWRAYEVLFNLCTKNVDVKVRFAHLQTNITNADFELETTNGTMTSQCTNNTGPWQPATIFSTPKKDTFGTTTENFDSIASSLSPQFQGYYISGANSYSPGVFSETLWAAFSATSAKNQSVAEQEDFHVGVVRSISQNVADILTNSIRKGPKDAASFNSCKDMVGTEYHENMVKVRWEWLTLLVVQVVSSIIFLVPVVVQTHSLQVDILKSQLLPVLLAVDPESKSAVLRGNTDKDVVHLQKQAPRVAAGLENQGVGWKLRKRAPAWI